MAKKTGGHKTPLKARIERETGTVRKEHGGRLKVALAYPNTYEVGMSNLGFQKVYHLFNQRDEVACERVFLPSAPEIEAMRKSRSPLAALESGLPMREFDLVCFSITFEADYYNVYAMLDLAGIPVARRIGEQTPWITAGGMAVTMNPEILAHDMELMFIGEAEGILDQLCGRIQDRGLNDLSDFADLPGVYVPSAYRPVLGEGMQIEKIEIEPGYPAKIQRVWNTNQDDVNITRVYTPDTVFGDMALVEVGKGCGKHCRFCAAGYVYRPTRFASYDSIIAAVDDALVTKNKVGLVGSAVMDHPDIERVFEHITGKGGEFSVSSLRVDKLSDHVIGLLAKGGMHTITLAPEAGTERLRQAVNKDIKDEAILEAVGRIAKAGAFNLKLYFLVGLPGETEEDVAAIVTLVQSIREAMVSASKERGTLGNITVGVNGFVPKPATPFQWAPFMGIKEVSARLKLVREGLAKTPNVKVQTGSAKADYLQTLLSVGGRWAGAALASAYRNNGDWKIAYMETYLQPDHFVRRRKEKEEIHPWSFIDHGLREDYLLRDYERSLKGKTIEECPPPGKRCERCGEFVGVCKE